ncbi:hypothetical protein [Fibrivirga algicola]|uniref:Uncharacterized protein n=1 Tax=Fibrivirga algicola TaxID=2950420 RepID=A0ABX0QJM4_9BACT|nr:hypothetical protein [Fibrivirga algicola]ARK12113.1 hypothetical protein A6C57_18240 [Fibrella sp. ES10-3-2-2]NID11053.1 hypothetical protein [Fibrivirga algicola]
MQTEEIRFFSPSENTEEVAPKKRSKKPVTVTGYISATGKLVLPNKSVEQLGINPAGLAFKVGAQAGKRKAKMLYLVPASASDSASFELVKAAKSYSISLPFILQKNGIDYVGQKYTFVVNSFDFDGGVTGYMLKLNKPAEKSGKVGRPKA